MQGLQDLTCFQVSRFAFFFFLLMEKPVVILIFFYFMKIKPHSIDF